MNLDPISISTSGYVCDLIPSDISISLGGYECVVGVNDINANIDGKPIICVNIDGILIISNPI